MDPDSIFRQITDLKQKIRASKNDAKASLQATITSADQIRDQIKKTSERLQMYRKMKALQAERSKVQKVDTDNKMVPKEYEISFKVVRNNSRREQKNTHFVERNLEELIMAIDAFDSYIV